MTYWDGTRWMPDAPDPAPAPPRRGRRLLGAAAEALLITGLIFGLIAGSAMAAKGGNGGGKPGGGGSGSSLALVMVDPADTQANHGDVVTFAVSTTSTDKPFVSLNCYQGGAHVYSASVGFFEAYPWAQTFTLASSYWTSGAADCTARLYKTRTGTRTTTLATLNLSVAP